ncbi:uncharacterized protein AKAME5_003008900 [Lates japonicus]|uniref:Ig-like domain-containing protein n=1 Tax=Lates japonicus TaxID=270547 RepID=A0AAD3RCX5_LATJO|nr:uncharacterized protein AKAME5_003008900 [Lates japonicus]
MSLFLILVLQCTAVTGQFSSFTVRVGHEVTLPCENVIDDQNNCDSTFWVFSDSSVELVTHGRISATDKSKSDRLSLTENCSLVIKKVTDEDVGRYDCQQYRPGLEQGQDTLIVLSVVTTPLLAQAAHATPPTALSSPPATSATETTRFFL